MSTAQWAALMLADESCAGSNSWKKFETAVKHITGCKHVLPTHQGRAAESILARAVAQDGHVIPNNSHFDATRANMEFAGALVLDALCDEGLDPARTTPFKGNTQSHFDYLVEVMETLWKKRSAIAGYRITYQPKFLRHFTCHFQPL
jgi:tryptophanase